MHCGGTTRSQTMDMERMRKSMVFVCECIIIRLSRLDWADMLLRQLLNDALYPDWQYRRTLLHMYRVRALNYEEFTI